MAQAKRKPNSQYAFESYHSAASVEELTTKNIETIHRLETAAKQKQTITERIAKLIADFCGSMTFVWVHVIWFGDTTLAFKYKFLSERQGSRLPAMGISGFVQFPTGNPSRSLGSGVTDYGFYLIAQKTVSKKNVLRVNGGYLFAGNTLNGVEGISPVKGKVVTANGSFVRKINEKLQLGVEITSAVSSSFELNKGQLQAQLGGNYQIDKKLSLDFGLIAGHFSASPRYGFQLGTSFDF